MSSRWGSPTEGPTDEILGGAEGRTRQPPRRSQLEVQMDVLRAVDEGAFLPTKIMYRANVGWVVLRDTLRILVARGLMGRTTAGGKRLYRLTPKGSVILASFDQVVRAVKLPLLAEVERRF